jgi:hypothetical protein
MPVEVLARPVVAHRRARVRVAGRNLHVAQADPGVERRGDERVSQHVRVHPRHPDPGGGGEMLEAAGGGVPVHWRAEGVAQDRPAGTVVDGTVDRPGDRGWQGARTTLPPLPRTRRIRWPCSSPGSAMLAPQASKLRSPSRPSIATTA